jgi:hypothetical protein
MSRATSRLDSGFALVLVIALLALAVLVILALSTLTRTNTSIAQSGEHQVQARQNALVAFSVALGELQRTAGPDDRVTGNAGITGIAANANNSTRHWCGIWRSDGSFIGWMVSGAQSLSPALATPAESIVLLGPNAVGAAAANSEHVVAGRIALNSSSGDRVGSYAYAILDEGVKTSAYAPAPVGAAPVIFANTTNAQSRLRDAVATYANSLPRALLYEQLAVLPTPATALTSSTIQDNLHHVSLTPRWVVGGTLQTGYFNVNTNSVHAWRNLLQTYNTSPAAPSQIAAATLSTRGTTLQNNAASFNTAGKATGGPFTAVVPVAAFLGTAFTSGSPTAAQIYNVLFPQLAVRSDTFRIRAYGEALNAANPGQLQSTAYCEAIVQRTPEMMPDGSGRRFVITYFRWLTPADI